MSKVRESEGPRNEITISITLKEYEKLLKDSKFLHKLQLGGIENWEWYEECLENE